MEGKIPSEFPPLAEEDATTGYSSASSNEDLEGDLELELSGAFVKALVNVYGNPPGLDLLSLNREERKVQISHDEAFEIFQVLYSSYIEEEPEPVSGLASASASGSGSNSSFTVSDEEDDFFRFAEEEEDLTEVLRQIQESELMEDAEAAFNAQMEEYQELEAEGKARFKDLVEKDKVLASREYSKIQEMKKLKWTMAQNVKCSQLKAAFPTLDDKVVDDVFLQSELKFDNALQYLKDIYPSKFVENGGRVELQPVVKTKDVSGNGDWFYEPDVVAALTVADKARLMEKAGFWRQEADRYNRLYEEAKKDAMDHVSQKQVCALKTVDATNFRHLGHKSLEKYWFFTLMGLNAGNKNPNKIDLHGLSVPKAKEIVNKYLQNRKAWAANYLRVRDTLIVTIITGFGRHSVNNIPKLYPAIRQFLTDNHYSYSEGEPVGNFVVRLSNVDATKSPSSKLGMKVAVKPQIKA